jgi:hypothetical protein
MTDDRGTYRSEFTGGIRVICIFVEGQNSLKKVVDDETLLLLLLYKV